MEQQLHFIRLDAGAFAVLSHLFGSDGKLTDVLPVSVLGMLLDNGVPRYAVTLQGPLEVGQVPIRGPEGTVVMGSSVWPSLEVYTKWAKENMQ